MTYVRKHADPPADARRDPIAEDFDPESPTGRAGATSVNWLLDAYIAGMLPAGRGRRLSWWPKDQSKLQRKRQSGFEDRLDQAWAEI